MDKIEIVSASTCPFAQRTRMVLLQKGVPFELTEIDLEAKPGWFLEISPYGKVPVLQHGETVLWESSIINEYLEEVFPEPALMPDEPAARAKARIWIDFANTRMVPHVYKMMLRQDEEGQELHRTGLAKAARVMEFDGFRALSDGRFWMGKEPGVVDFTFFPHVQRFAVLQHYRDFEIPEECVRLRQWIDAMSELDAIRITSAPDETLIANWRKYALNTGTGVTAREMRESG